VAAAHFSGENGPREDYWSDVVSEIRLDESKFSSATCGYDCRVYAVDINPKMIDFIRKWAANESYRKSIQY